MDLDRLPSDIFRELSGGGFGRRRRLVVPLLTTDPDGFPRAALLALGEVRATSPTLLAVAVRAGSRAAANLLRRKTATILLLDVNRAASIRALAGRARPCESDPTRQIFPLKVAGVKIDTPAKSEGNVGLKRGPEVGGRGYLRLFSEDVFAELGRAAKERA
ncbi:MAG TPA: hypothetical protein VIB08_09745 [Thermoanaerobaculia bacterium]|jgi:hypothetical protein